MGPGRNDRAVLGFDPLDRLATAAEIAAGRAIFSLEGTGAEVRRLPMPSFPVKARWTKLEVLADDGPGVRAINAKNVDRRYIEGLQTGWVWQAEEVREGNRWRRYYGFVGHHVLTRVTARRSSSRCHDPARRSGTVRRRLIIKEAAVTVALQVECAFRNHFGVSAGSCVRRPQNRR